MRNIENINTKGNTNVKADANSEMRGEKIFDSVNADVIRDESKWDAFQLVGDTNREEMIHKAITPDGYADTERASQKRERFVNERIRKFGGRVTAVYNFALR